MRNSVFKKIFLWFWLAMTMIGATVVILALTTGSDGEDRAMRQRRYRIESQQLIKAYLEGGAAAYRNQRRLLEEKTGSRLFLRYNSGEGVIDESLDPTLIPLVQLAAETHVNQVQSGDQEIWIAYPATEEYVYLINRTRPNPLATILDPRALGLRMIITFIVAGVVCFLLARSLTAPIGRLRRATRAFAAGALSTRVNPPAGANDEIAGLARDFDQMAARIENLINAEHRLLQDISHELRSPLTRLMLALELTRQHVPPGATPSLDRIEREAGRLNELIGQLLTLTMMESQAGITEWDAIDLQGLLAEIVLDADFEARSKGCRVDLATSDAVIIAASRELLRQGIENVIRNAMRSTERNTIVTVALAVKGGSQGDEVVITVRDHGPGISEAQLEKVFLPFYRTEQARDRQSGGYGLGLAITQRAVRLHGGSVTARNVTDGGLLVEIRLPLQSND